jgi:hypothetical protein
MEEILYVRVRGSDDMPVEEIDLSVRNPDFETH